MERVYEMIEIIQKAFPDGIDAVYDDLICCLKDAFTNQNLAALLSYVDGRDMNVVKRDILKKDDDTFDEKVLEALVFAGYNRA